MSATEAESFRSMARTLKSDRWLFYTTLFLVGLSVVMVYSASAVPAVRRFESTAEHFLYRQLVYAIGGFFLLFAAMRVDYHVFQRPAVIWSLFVATLVCLVAVFAWPARNGATRWIDLWIVSFQPSELAKLVLIVFTARVLDCRMHRIGELGYAVAPVAVASLLLIGLIYAEPDLGTSVMVALIVGSMLFVAGLRLPHLALAAVIALAAVALAVAVAPYRMGRLMQMFTGGHQMNQSIIAIGSGGFSGLGLTQGIQKLFYLPEAHTDFIFAVIGEELGLVGTTLVLACFLFMAWRGLRIALLAPDRFGALLAVGITAMVALQALINITVVMGLAPTKGIPLPFVSSGGSSLVMNLTAMGILLNVSQQALPVKTVPASQRSWILGQEMSG
jgi:cell division protein FtsW